MDAIVNENKNIKNHWSLYKRMIRIIKSDLGISIFNKKIMKFLYSR